MKKNINNWEITDTIDENKLEEKWKENVEVLSNTDFNFSDFRMVENLMKDISERNSPMIDFPLINWIQWQNIWFKFWKNQESRGGSEEWKNLYIRIYSSPDSKWYWIWWIDSNWLRHAWVNIYQCWELYNYLKRNNWYSWTIDDYADSFLSQEVYHALVSTKNEVLSDKMSISRDPEFVKTRLLDYITSWWIAPTIKNWNQQEYDKMYSIYWEVFNDLINLDDVNCLSKHEQRDLIQEEYTWKAADDTLITKLKSVFSDDDIKNHALRLYSAYSW